jgi:hypothetical protein
MPACHAFVCTCVLLLCRGDTAPLDAFKAYFQDKHLDNGTNVVLLWRQPDALDVLTCPPGTPIDDFSKVRCLPACLPCWCADGQRGESRLVPFAGLGAGERV